MAILSFLFANIQILDYCSKAYHFIDKNLCLILVNCSRFIDVSLCACFVSTFHRRGVTWVNDLGWA